MYRIATLVSLALIAGACHAQSDAALAAQFKQLDSNSDGLLSENEARASSRVSELYESLDTSGTIEADARNNQPGGITYDQFEAGMTAADKSGSVGPAASGGETFKVYPDGTSERVEGTGVGKKP